MEKSNKVYISLGLYPETLEKVDETAAALKISRASFVNMVLNGAVNGDVSELLKVSTAAIKASKKKEKKGKLVTT